MKTPNMHCPSRCKNCTSLGGAANYYISCGTALCCNGNLFKFGPVYIKMKLQVWRVQKVLPQSVKKPYLPVWGRKLPHFMRGSIGPRMEICVNSGLPIGIVPRFHKKNVIIKRKLRVWRAQKCIALFRGKTPPACAGLQTTPFHGGEYKAKNGNMRSFGPTNPHGTAFPPKKCLQQK